MQITEWQNSEKNVSEGRGRLYSQAAGARTRDPGAPALVVAGCRRLPGPRGAEPPRPAGQGTRHHGQRRKPTPTPPWLGSELAPPPPSPRPRCQARILLVPTHVTDTKPKQAIPPTPNTGTGKRVPMATQKKRKEKWVPWVTENQFLKGALGLPWWRSG